MKFSGIRSNYILDTALAKSNAQLRLIVKFIDDIFAIVGKDFFDLSDLNIQTSSFSTNKSRVDSELLRW